MPSTYVMKRNDRRPHYRVQLTAGGTPVDLTAATAVKFYMVPAAGSTPVVNASATFIDKPSGVVEYAWTAGDTATPGDYNIEFEVNWNPELQTFPSTGFFTLTIVADLV